jgi:D-alanyl-D-alanine carboxypeptidase
MIFSRSSFALAAAAVLVLTAPSGVAATKKQPMRPSDPETGTYRGAIVVDAATGNVLFEDRADTVSPPASMTKLMTFAVLYDKLSNGTLTLDTPVRIVSEDAKIGGTQVFLDPRETFPVEELIYAMMIQSANDAANALGRAVGGSRDVFVEMMNAKAHELGMNHTTFRSPHGLPPANRRIEDGDLTTPRDYALLCRYLLLKTNVLKYTSVVTRDFGVNRSNGPQHMENHNKLLGKVPGVDGLKTGYTEGAGYCLSATAERGGHRVIVVIMGSFGPNGKTDKGHARDLKAMELIGRGFAAMPADSPPFVGAVPPSPLKAVSAPAAAALTEKKAGDPTVPSEGEPMIKFSVPTAPKKK